MPSDTPAEQAEPFKPDARCYNRRWCVEAGRCTNAAPCKAEPSDEALIEQEARELLAAAYEERVGEGPYPSYAKIARSGSGDFTKCAIRAVKAALRARLASKDEALARSRTAENDAKGRFLSVAMMRDIAFERAATAEVALAKAQGRIVDLTQQMNTMTTTYVAALAGYREQAEAAEGRIAELEAKEESALRVADKNLSRAIHAEAALAECRAVGWFTTTNNGALLFQQSDDDPREVHDNGRPVYRALAKEAPRHE